MYSALEMLYATHVLEGRITDTSKIPASVRDNVLEIVANAKKQETAGE
ncbi:hypothetical protein [Enterococcus asini]|nr:hypothetical protein [Enterococcus asini]